MPIRTIFFFVWYIIWSDIRFLQSNNIFVSSWKKKNKKNEKFHINCRYISKHKVYNHHKYILPLIGEKKTLNGKQDALYIDCFNTWMRKSHICLWKISLKSTYKLKTYRIEFRHNDYNPFSSNFVLFHSFCIFSFHFYWPLPFIFISIHFHFRRTFGDAFTAYHPVCKINAKTKKLISMLKRKTKRRKKKKTQK